MKEMTVTVNLVSGDKIAFKFEADETRARNVAGNIEKSMSAQYVGVEMDDKVTLVPIHNVASVEVSPSPGSLIANVVRDVQRLD